MRYTCLGSGRSLSDIAKANPFTDAAAIWQPGLRTCTQSTDSTPTSKDTDTKTDIIARLNNLGLKKKFAKFRAVEFHLHHRQKEFVEANKQIFRDNLTVTACRHGIRNLDYAE